MGRSGAVIADLFLRPCVRPWRSLLAWPPNLSVPESSILDRNAVFRLDAQMDGAGLDPRWCDMSWFVPKKRRKRVRVLQSRGRDGSPRCEVRGVSWLRVTLPRMAPGTGCFNGRTIPTTVPYVPPPSGHRLHRLRSRCALPCPTQNMLSMHLSSHHNRSLAAPDSRLPDLQT